MSTVSRASSSRAIPSSSRCARGSRKGRSAEPSVEVEATRISDSCGYGVPLYGFEKERSQLVDWAERKEETELNAYQRKKNALSIDGLPAVTWLDPRDEEAKT